jgi:hypothetical protein
VHHPVIVAPSETGNWRHVAVACQRAEQLTHGILTLAANGVVDVIIVERDFRVQRGEIAAPDDG